MKYGIIGFGCAGYNAAVAIRSCNKNAQIDVYEKTDKPPFNPMLSTYLASERLLEDEVFPFGEVEQIVKRLQINLYQGAYVTHVDTQKKMLRLKDGTEKQYDAILISTGADAFIPGFLKCNSQHLFLMRTLEEAKALKAYITTHSIKRAVVVGGSMVGIKVAELLWRRHIQVTLVDAAPYIFPLAAYPEIAHKIEDYLIKQKGLEIVMNAMVSDIQDDGIVLADGKKINGEIVCLCIGTKANLELVANVDVVSDQEIEVHKGIVIDSHGKSSCEGIYAAGDCCEGINLQTGKTSIIGLWANAASQGKCAGRNMAGVAADYYGNILHNITHFFDMDFIGLGDPAIEGDKYTFEKDDFIISLIKSQDKLKSINIIGNYSISGILKNHLTKQLMGVDTKLSSVQKGLLLHSGLDESFIELIGG